MNKKEEKYPPITFVNDGTTKIPVVGEGLTITHHPDNTSVIHFDAFDELEYLRYFYDAVQPILEHVQDITNTNCKYDIRQRYKEETGNVVPEKYEDE